jgi:hypothetical protein
LAEATKLAPCQVHSNTESPCPRRAEVEILGVAFCEPCARQQEAYFAIGDLMDEEETHSLCSKPLAEALKRIRRERTDSTERAAAQMHHGLSGVHQNESLALRSG